MNAVKKTDSLLRKTIARLKGGRVSSQDVAQVEYALEDTRAKIFFGIVFFVLSCLLIMTLRPYLSAIILALLVAALIHPIYHKIRSRLGWSPRIITSLIIIVLIIITVVLVFFIGRSLVQEALNLSSAINNYIANGGTADLQAKVAQLTKSSGLNSQSATDFITSSLQQLSGQLASFATGVIKNSFAFFVSVTVFLAGLVLLIPRMSQIKRGVIDISPLSRSITSDYIEKTRLLLKGAVVGSFVISLCASTIMGITFWLLHIPNALLFATMAFFLGFIPYLGTTIFTFGAAIIFIVLGAYDKAAVLILVQLLILNQLDLVFRPISMPRKVRIHPALMIVAVMAGLATFGMIGIIFGPVILVLFMSSVEIYQQNYGSASSHKVTEK